MQFFHSLVLLEDEHKIPKSKLRPGYEKEKGSRKHRSCQYTIDSKRGRPCHKRHSEDFLERSRSLLFLSSFSNSISERRNYGSRNCKKTDPIWERRKRLQDLYFIPRKEECQVFMRVGDERRFVQSFPFEEMTLLSAILNL